MIQELFINRKGKAGEKMNRKMAAIFLLILFIFSASMYFATRVQGPLTLTVYSDYDTPNPPVGPNTYNYNDSVTCSFSSSTPDPSATQYVCTGWAGTGNVPPSGIVTSVDFTIAQPSSITGNWKTQYLLNKGRRS